MLKLKKDFVVNPADFEDYEYGTESTGYVYINASCKNRQTSTNYYTSETEPLRIELCFDPKTGNIAYFTFMVENGDDEIIQEDHIKEHISLEELIPFVTYDESVRENVATPEVVENLRLSCANLTYRFYISFKLNRPMTAADSSPSFGSVTVNTKDDKFMLDFDDICGYHEDKAPDVLIVEMKNPNYEDFEDCKRITERDMRNIINFEDIYVDIEDEDLQIIKVENAAFVLPYDDFKQIDISDKVCKLANIS